MRSLPGIEIETIGFDEDHLHMMILIPTKYSISDVMSKLKSQSSHHMRKTFSWLSKLYHFNFLTELCGHFDELKNYYFEILSGGPDLHLNE
ncbi:transposase [Vibrio owensii]|uniref:transposase n=1 Tax=Vibrio owensii TaxID=696485 RepID=UPI00391F54AD